jgi:hypothetical protein
MDKRYAIAAANRSTPESRVVAQLQDFIAFLYFCAMIAGLPAKVVLAP